VQGTHKKQSNTKTSASQSACKCISTPSVRLHYIGRIFIVFVYLRTSYSDFT